MKRIALLTAVLTLLIAGCGGAPAPSAATVVVSAAASLTDAMKEIQTDFQSANPNIKLQFNFGSSGALQQQVEQGAPVDLFISAAKDPMDALTQKGLVDPAAVKSLVSNKVVLIRGKAGEAVVTAWSDLASDKVKRIAIGDPQHVPAGQYGKAVLETLGLWSAVQNRLVLGSDVRQVLTYVESGDVQAGIVYSTEAASSQKVVVVAEAPAGSHPPVIYPMAVLKGAKNAAQAQVFADYLLSERGKSLLQKYGFTSPQ